jgi:hypothetical protein
VSAVEGPAVERDDPTLLECRNLDLGRGPEQNLVYFQEVENLWRASLTLAPNLVRSSFTGAQRSAGQASTMIDATLEPRAMTRDK